MILSINSMFQMKRTIALFLFFIVSTQALFYILNLQRTQSRKTIPVTSKQSSDKPVESATTATLPSITNASHPSVIVDYSPFLNASFSPLTNLSVPDPSVYPTLAPCQFSISSNSSTWFRVPINQKIVSYELIETGQGQDLHPGGHWFPRTCRAEQRLAIIVCYRNRELHLKLFLNNIHSFLKQQQLDYTIFVVNQHGTEQFNRAALFNVGYLEAMKLYPFDCFIFHDVDLLPEDLRNLYKCGDKPRHMSVAVDKFNYRLLYATLFGGVTAFNISDFLGTNGYPTVFWGWGGEDDDMYLRVKKKLKKSITRYPMEIARYKMIRSMNHTSGKVNPHRHAILYSNYDYNRDGINSIRYQLHRVVLYQLFTLINVTLNEESFEQLRQRLNFTVKPAKKKG